MRRWARPGTTASRRENRAGPRVFSAFGAGACASLPTRSRKRSSASATCSTIWPIDHASGSRLHWYCASPRSCAAATNASRVRSRWSDDAPAPVVVVLTRDSILAIRGDVHVCSLLVTGRPRVARQPVVWRDRMPLHPKVQALLTAQRLSGAPAMHTLSPERARAEMRAQVAAVSGPLAAVARFDGRRRRAGRARCRCASTHRPGRGSFPASSTSMAAASSSATSTRTIRCAGRSPYGPVPWCAPSITAWRRSIRSRPRPTTRWRRRAGS